MIDLPDDRYNAAAVDAIRSLGGPASGDYPGGATSMFTREPFGVVAGVTPWNFPPFASRGYSSRGRSQWATRSC